MQTFPEINVVWKVQDVKLALQSMSVWNVSLANTGPPAKRRILAENTSSSEVSTRDISDTPRVQQKLNEDGQLKMSQNQPHQIVTDTTYQNPSYQNLDSPNTGENMYAELQDVGSR